MTGLRNAALTVLSHLEHMSNWIGRRGGYSFESLGEDQDSVRLLREIPEGFEWINKRAIVRGEDFEYKAVVLCSFPKTSGKVRYIVEDNGRIFVQREDQIKFIEDRPFKPPEE